MRDLSETFSLCADPIIIIDCQLRSDNNSNSLRNTRFDCFMHADDSVIFSETEDVYIRENEKVTIIKIVFRCELKILVFNKYDKHLYCPTIVFKCVTQ